LAGKILCVLPDKDAPSLGDEIVLMCKLHITEDCVADHESGERVLYRKTRLVAAWREGTPPPIDTAQPDLWEGAPPEGSIQPEFSG
jgi:hypothetical protein